MSDYNQASEQGLLLKQKNKNGRLNPKAYATPQHQTKKTIQKPLRLNEHCEKLLQLQMQYVESAQVSDLVHRLEANSKLYSMGEIKQRAKQCANTSIISGHDHDLDNQMDKYVGIGQAKKKLDFMPLKQSQALAMNQRLYQSMAQGLEQQSGTSGDNILFGNDG